MKKLKLSREKEQEELTDFEADLSILTDWFAENLQAQELITNNAIVSGCFNAVALQVVLKWLNENKIQIKQ